jgi:hypothetical protein
VGYYAKTDHINHNYDEWERDCTAADRKLLDDTKDEDLPLLINKEWFTDHLFEEYKRRISNVGV